jgi:hypothetical protein
MKGVHAILGLRGYGKSRLFRALCADETKLIVVDTLGEHDGLGTRVDISGMQTLLVRNPEAYRIIFRPVGYDGVEWVERVAAARPGCSLAVDEIDMWYPDSRAPVGDGLRSLVMYGRHYDQGIIAVARRPFNMSRDLTSQADLWCFPMREPRDRDYVRSVTGFDPGGLRVLETGMLDGKEIILRTELARVGARGTEIGEFDLVAGQYRF